MAPRIAVSSSGDSRLPSTLFLQSHVFVGRAKRHWVVLDVHRDKYLCVGRKQFEALGPRLHGWERPSLEGACVEGACESDTDLDQADSDQADLDQADGLANQLLSLEVLSERPEGTKDARPTAYPLPTEAMEPDLPTRWRRSACVHALPFFASCAKASRQLSRRSFQSTVEFVKARKSRPAALAGRFDLDRARSLVSVFARLRLFYPRGYLCLFDSLALIHFLAFFGVYPDWVFGVLEEPFESHCWVQAGRVVLNDRVAQIAGYTPIMSV
jgi:hypothetical protein